MILKKTICALAAAAAMTLAPAAQAGEAGPTVKSIIDRGELLCTGHNGTYLGFAEVADDGSWQGFDIELCHALAAMILGDKNALQIIPISFAQRFPSLQSGDIDVIIKVTGWTMGRDTDLGLQFTRPYFLGATQILAKAEIGATDATGIEGAVICTRAGTSTERITADYLTNLGIEHEVVKFEKSEEMRAAYFAGRCDAFAGWGPNLAIVRSQAENPDDHIVLSDVMAVEPQSFGMRQGDDNFVDVGNWMMTAMLIAEQYGVTSANVDEMLASPPNPTVERLLGASPGIGERLGLPDDWAYQVIKQVGNYQEVYDRTLGTDSAYELDRGPNELINNGGILFPLVLD